MRVWSAPRIPDAVLDRTADTPDVAVPEIPDLVGDAGMVIGVPCDGPEDCPGGLCVDLGIESLCTTWCIEECPEGWDCLLMNLFGADPEFLCVPGFWQVCRACETDEDCMTQAQHCVDLGADGGRCVLSCEDDGACPSAYHCVAAGAAGTVCLPESGSCSCAGDDDAGSLRDCLITNVLGSCPGTQECLGVAGWTPCDGPEAVGEECNGADDDCDGATDEDFPDLDGDLLADCVDPDDDDDGIPDGTDNCPKTPNTGQEDLDGDALGDPCDDDRDGDGVANDADSCPDLSNPLQADLDLDGLGDVCDPDDDNDTVADGDDNCSLAPNPGQEDLDLDGLGDVCDPDDDNDGTPDDVDNCPTVSNPGQDDLDQDLLGDACDPDDDGDGILDAVDNCPSVQNPLQEDLDADGLGDACDTDDDGDSVPDATDNCPLATNTDQADCEGDGLGDAGDPDDDDDDGAPDGSDCQPCDASILPGAVEACNGLDDNCNSVIDEGAEGWCLPYACGGVLGCLDACDAQFPCQEGWFCDANDLDADQDTTECLPLLAGGQPCTGDFECADGTCSNGHCCGAAGELCCAADQDCAGLDTAPICDAPGTCTGHHLDGWCNEAHVCKVSQVPDPLGCTGSLCAPGKYCVGAEVHLDRYCTPQGTCTSDGVLVQGCLGSNTCCDYWCADGACGAAFRSSDVGCVLACAYQPLFCFCW